MIPLKNAGWRETVYDYFCCFRFETSRANLVSNACKELAHACKRMYDIKVLDWEVDRGGPPESEDDYTIYNGPLLVQITSLNDKEILNKVAAQIYLLFLDNKNKTFPNDPDFYHTPKKIYIDSINFRDEHDDVLIGIKVFGTQHPLPLRDSI